MEFVSGVELARRFYAEAIRPLLDRAFPGLPHAAALIGPGSEILGFDTARSTDHDWEPRAQLFCSPTDLRRHGPELEALLAGLPDTFGGWPRERPVEVTEVGDWCRARLGFDPLASGPLALDPLASDPRDGIPVADWLATPTQLLAEATGGAVFHDDLGSLTAVRESLRWYPDDVGRYVLAAQWARIGEEEPFVGRCAETGDELGSAILAARLARDVMRLCLLMARRYPPYSKWLGTAFARLPGIEPIRQALTGALAAGWPKREDLLCTAYEAVASWHNALGLTAPVDPSVRPFHDRPFLVLDAFRFAEALQATITDPALRTAPLVGAVDQFADNTAVLSHPQRAHSLTVLTQLPPPHLDNGVDSAGSTPLS
jgi:hypothetical protein